MCAILCRYWNTLFLICIFHMFKVPSLQFWWQHLWSAAHQEVPKKGRCPWVTISYLCPSHPMSSMPCDIWLMPPSNLSAGANCGSNFAVASAPAAETTSGAMISAPLRSVTPVARPWETFTCRWRRSSAGTAGHGEEAHEISQHQLYVEYPQSFCMLCK